MKRPGLGTCELDALTPPAPASALEIQVTGDHFVNGSGEAIRLIGVNRSGSEYACSGPDGQGGNGYGFARPT
jgi:hypothetical protein